MLAFDTWYREAAVIVTVAGLGAVAQAMRSHDRTVDRLLRGLDDQPVDLAPAGSGPGEDRVETLDPMAPTAILCVGTCAGFARHLTAAAHRLLPGYFRNVLFIAAAVPGDAGLVEAHLEACAVWARSRGLNGGWGVATGDEPVPAMERLCRSLVREFPHGVVIIGMPVFEDRDYPHSAFESMAAGLERALRFQDIPAIVLPVAVPDEPGQKEESDAWKAH